MKLADFTDRLVASFRESAPSDLLRQLREQSEHPDFRGKTVAGGAPDVTLFSAGFVPVAIMLGGPRSSIAARTYDIWNSPVSGSVQSAAAPMQPRSSDDIERVGDWSRVPIDTAAARPRAPEVPPAPPRPQPLQCGLTGQYVFGEALTAILTDDQLRRRVKAVAVATNQSWASIMYSGDAGDEQTTFVQLGDVEPQLVRLALVKRRTLDSIAAMVRQQ